MNEHTQGERTELSELGEFGLIHRLSQYSGFGHNNTIMGIGDDAAVIKTDGDKVVLLATDMMAEGIHFDLSYMPLKHLGFKLVSVNISDIVAMNGKATHIVLSMALSNRFSVEAVEELYKGVDAACKHYGVELVGGDTSSSRSGLVLSLTAYGVAEESELCFRHGASKSDLLCVTGDLGGAFMGLKVLQRDKAEWEANPDMQPDLESYAYLIERQLRPVARIDMKEQFSGLGIQPGAMIDISDGLASELFHLAKHNDLGVTIYEEKLPIDPLTYNTAREFQLDPTTIVLNGGEDYELLFTLPLSDFEKLKNNPDITVIGHMTSADQGKQLVTKSGNQVSLRAQGWVHF